MFRQLVVFVALLAFSQGTSFVQSQAPKDSKTTKSAAIVAGHSTDIQTSPVASKPSENTPNNQPQSANPDESTPSNQQPQIIVNPTPAPVGEWTWHDRAAWGAGIVLAALGYVGILLALRTLKSIDRHLEAGTATSQAAMDSASAALALAQAIANSERPWIVVTVEPFLTMENSFKVMASNRGRSPARITTSMDQVRIELDETHLPKEPEFDKVDGADAPEPIVLLPGEATGIWAFNREDLPAICKSSEVLKCVERWTDTLFLFGRITYLDLNAPPDKQLHETFWCCRYIHGEKSSALVMAGPPAYNKHT